MALTVAAIQMAMVDDVDTNVATAERLVRKAAAEGAQLALIPELFEGPYFCKDMLPEHFDRARRGRQQLHVLAPRFDAARQLEQGCSLSGARAAPQPDHAIG